MRYPLVSLMTPVRDRAEMMRETVDSLLLQEYPNTEVILVESGSTDHTWEVCQEYDERHIHVHAFQIEEATQYAAYQACVENAIGEYGCFVWSDDTVAPLYVGFLLGQMDEDVGFAYCPAIIGDGARDGYIAYRHSGTNEKYDSKDFIEYALRLDGTVPVSPGCAMFRVKDMGIFRDPLPEEYRSILDYPEAGLDIALFIKTALKYPKVGYCPWAMAYFRKHNDSITIKHRGEVMEKYGLVLQWLSSLVGDK